MSGDVIRGYEDLGGMGVNLTETDDLYGNRNFAHQFAPIVPALGPLTAQIVPKDFLPRVSEIVDALPTCSVGSPVVFALPGRQQRAVLCWSLLEQAYQRPFNLKRFADVPEWTLRVSRSAPKRQQKRLHLVKRWNQMPQLEQELRETIETLDFTPDTVAFGDSLAYRLAYVIRELHRRDRSARLIWSVGCGCGSVWDTKDFSCVIEPSPVAAAV